MFSIRFRSLSRWHHRASNQLRALGVSDAGLSMASQSSSTPSPSSSIDLLMLLHKLKTTKRTGWVRKGVHQPESIADHMYRMGVMAMIAGPAGGVDSNRCVRMALVHDIAEAIVGDITPHCKVSNEEKHRMESEAIEQIKGMLGPETDAALEVEALWREYEAATSPEALLVKDFDKLEMVLQALQYEQEQGQRLQEFFDSTEGKWRTELGRSWAQEVVRRRQALQQAGEQQQRAGQA